MGILCFVGGCAVGPNYQPPSAPLAEHWRESGDPQVGDTTATDIRWWAVFGDPILDRLIEAAFRQNQSLQAAGLRILQAQARRGIARGNLFPQTQQISGGYSRSRRSTNTAVPVTQRDIDAYDVGFDAIWEIDLWGRFRRAIEAADAQLLAAVADYDDVLVTLIGEVAANYVQIGVLDERLALARDNVSVQQDSLSIARVRFEAGGTSDLDVQQATALLEDTAASIPQLEIQRRQVEDSLSVLLGTPPQNFATLMPESPKIPSPPLAVAVSIPAELLARRPDVRRAERQLAAQSAQIGVAQSQLYPHLQLNGSIGLSAESAGKLVAGDSFEAVAGPSFNWPILNYGRLVNAVRVEDARFQELLADYAQTVLEAQREVEDALVGFLRGNEQVARLGRAVAAANRAVELALIQYREGAADFTRVLTAQQSKLHEDDELVSARGAVTLSVIRLYKALGGGWEIRDGIDFVPEATKAAMRQRTWWGNMLDDQAQPTNQEEQPWWRLSRWW